MGQTLCGRVPTCRLEKVGLVLVSPDDCRQLVGGDQTHQFDEGSMLCAAPAVGGDDTCSGDNGGPLILGTDPRQGPVIGVTSWGNGCGAATPGVYARSVAP